MNAVKQTISLSDYHGRVFTLGVSKPAVKILMEEARNNYSALGAADEEASDEGSGPSDASCYRVVTPPSPSENVSLRHIIEGRIAIATPPKPI